MKLNGWQRVWVVFSAVWIIAVAASAITLQRSEQTRYHEWANALVQYLIEQSPDLRGHTQESVRAAYSDMTDRQLVDALHEKYLGKHPAYSYGFSEIDAKHSSGVSEPKLYWLLAGIGVPFVLYLLGLSVSWVRAGFKHA